MPGTRLVTQTFVSRELQRRDAMSDEVNQPRRPNLLIGFLLGAAVVALAVFGYLYYQQQREVVKIDVPGFSGTITKEPDGFSAKIGKDNGVDIKVD